MNVTTAAKNLDIAKAATASAIEALEVAKADLAEIKATIVELDRAYDSEEPLPKNHQSKVDAAQGRLIQLDRLVTRREAAVEEARTAEVQAEAEHVEARLVSLAETVVEFDRDAWIEKVRASCQPIIDQHLDELYAVRDAYLELTQEIRADRRHEYPRNLHAGRVGMSDGFYKDPTFDGQRILQIEPSKIVDDLGGALVDTRHEEQVRRAQAEERAQRAEEQAARQAEAAEFRRQNEAKWSQAPTGARVSRDRDGNEHVITARHGDATQGRFRQV